MKPKAAIWWGVAGICLAAFVAITITNSRIFERVPHSEDEVAYIFQAKVFARNRLFVPTPPNSDAFWTPFVVDYQGRRFGKYPPGWPLLLSLAVRLNAAWLANAILGTLTLALIARLGRCFYRPATGLWAAGLGLLTPAFLFQSGSLLSHPASLFWCTLALLSLFYAVTRRPLYALATGLALGAAFVTRPFAALGLGLPVGIFVAILVLRRNLQWTALLWLAAGSAATGWLLPLYWWAVTGNPWFNAYLLVWPYDRPGFGPDVGPYGYGLREAIFINTRLKLATLVGGLFGWPGWSNLLFLPLPFLTRRGNRWDGLLLGIIAGMVAVHIFYWSFGGADGGMPRYYYDALPAFLLLTVRGIQRATKWLGRVTLFGRGHAGWLPVGLVVILVGYNLIWNLPPLLAAQKGKYHITPAPLQAVEQAHLTEPALVMVKNITGWHNFAAPFAANSPTLDGPVVYAIDWGPELSRQVRRQFSRRVCLELQENSLTPCGPLKEKP